jgi:uncharacterized protein (UPF0332 family)
MQGRAFLEVAREVVVGSTEAHWRATVVHAYYALVLECRDVLKRWGIPIASHHGIHSIVRLRFVYAANPDLKRLGRALEKWCQQRNRASYDLGALPIFTTDRLAQDALTEVTAALDLLDAIDADPVRRAAAIAALPP